MIAVYVGLFNPFINTAVFHLGGQSHIIPVYVSQSIIDSVRLDRYSEIDLVTLPNGIDLLARAEFNQPIRFKEEIRIFRQTVGSFSFNGFSYFVVNQKISAQRQVRVVRVSYYPS